MPLFRPSILLSDAYGSAGEVTFYHRNGRCYTRRRVKPPYPGTPAQLEHLAIHRRAMEAWASLDSEVQKLWNSYETTAESHRPPYDHKSHISGNNLFISAYHGVATEMVRQMRPDINADELIQPEEIAEIIRFLVTREGQGTIDQFYIRRYSGLAFD